MDVVEVGRRILSADACLSDSIYDIGTDRRQAQRKVCPPHQCVKAVVADFLTGRSHLESELERPFRLQMRLVSNLARHADEGFAGQWDRRRRYAPKIWSKMNHGLNQER